jgi:uncharacterized protein (DUF885 family)
MRSGGTARWRSAAAGQPTGVGRLPDGAAYNALMLRQMTTTDDTPDPMHALGLAEVTRISPGMDRWLAVQGLTAGTVGERMRALGRDPRFRFPDTDAGRAQLLARYRRNPDEPSARLPVYFRTLPPNRRTVERMPLSAAKGSAGACDTPATMDGSRSGTFYGNPRSTTETAGFAMKTLAYREAIPGHHFQVSRAARRGSAAVPRAAAVRGLRRGRGALRRTPRRRDGPVS